MSHPGIVFLMYHEIEVPGRPLAQSEPGYVRYIVPKSAFENQIQWLRENGWRGLNVSEALRFPEGKFVALTFDDGCETDLTAAAGILQKAQFQATFYVTTGFSGKPGYLTPAQLRELAAAGFEIGCHSMTHSYLNDLGPAELEREVVEARLRLEEIAAAKVEHFSCPGGRYDELTLSLARKSRYKSVATSHLHANHPSTDPFRLGRIAIMRDTSPAAFRNICTATGLWKARLAERALESARIVLGNRLYDRVRSRVLRDSSRASANPQV